MKVAVGVDGSDLSYQAVRLIGKLLSPKVDDLLLYFSPPEFHLSSKTPLTKDVLKSASWALAAGIFDTATNYLSPEMQQVTSTLRDESLPADGLTQLAEEEDVDLVVVGSQGAARKFPFLLGSTARTIVHHTGKPVLVVRGEDKKDSGPMKVLIACDEDRWVDAGGVLRDLSWPEKTQVILFHVTEALGEEYVDSVATTGSSRIPNATQMVAEYRAAIEKRSEACRQRLKSLKKDAPTVMRNAVVEVEQGNVVDEIIAKVEREEADLLVVSSRKLSTLGRMLGSVTESLLSRCPCSLLIVHDRPQEKLDPKAKTRGSKHASQTH